MNIENKRFKEVRAFMGKNQNEFGAMLNIEQGTVSDIERGKSGVSKHVKSVLFEKLKVSEKWWNSGSGKIFGQDLEIENKGKNNETSIFSPDYWKDKYLRLLEENNELLKERNKK